MKKHVPKRSLGFETRMLHAGHVPDAATGSRAVPVFQTTSYVFDSAESAANLFDLKQYGSLYTRTNNPTTAVFEERMASLEGGAGALATASGMAAQFTTMMTLLEAGDHVVSSSHLYGGTQAQFAHALRKLGISVSFVDPGEPGAWERAIRPQTKALYTETIGNPQGSIADFDELAGLATAHGMPLIVDNTLASPYLCRPIALGADIVVHSATKFIGGHGNSIGGVIVEGGRFRYHAYPSIASPSPSYHGMRFDTTFGHQAFLMKARMETMRDAGACLSPLNAFLLLQGLDTLSLRMERHVDNAMAVASFLAEHPKVDSVAYAGLPDSKYHAAARRYLPKGVGAVLSFNLGASEQREAGRVFIEALELFSHLASVGDARSLVIHPASTTHRQLSDEDLASCGIGPGMIRLSVGLETLEDLLWDLDQALRVT